jgi:hypothetical protein
MTRNELGTMTEALQQERVNFQSIVQEKIAMDQALSQAISDLNLIDRVG